MSRANYFRESQLCQSWLQLCPTRIPVDKYTHGDLKLFRIRGYRFSEFLEALKTPTRKESGSENSECSEKWTFPTYFGHFLDEKKLNIYQNFFLNSVKRFSFRLDEFLRRKSVVLQKLVILKLILA